MQYHLQAANLTQPTIESFYEYAALRWDNLQRLLGENAEIRAVLTKIGTRKLFELRVEVNIHGQLFYFKTIQTSITEAVDKANKLIKRKVTKLKQ